MTKTRIISIPGHPKVKFTPPSSSIPKNIRHRVAPSKSKRASIADHQRSRWVSTFPNPGDALVPFSQVQREFSSFAKNLFNKHLPEHFSEVNQLTDVAEAFEDAIIDLKQPSLISMAMDYYLDKQPVWHDIPDKVAS